MNPLDAHKILMQREINEGHLLLLRFSGLLAINSILVVAFFLALPQENLRLLCIGIATLGILVCVILGIALRAGAKATIGLYDALYEIEQEPDFDYMRAKGVRPFRDISGLPALSLWKLGFRVSAFLPLAGVALWIVSLIVVFS